MTDDDLSEHKHWYCFTFIDNTMKGDIIYSCAYVGYYSRDPLITKKEIQRVKVGAEVKPTAVLLAVSYLGFMTKKDFDDENEQG